jgi:type II secretory pathway pseudopilin PulG
MAVTSSRVNSGDAAADNLSVQMLRALAGWRRKDPGEGEEAGEDGFTIMETVVAVIIVFAGLLALMSTATVGLVDAAMARQRQTATAIANQVLEQIRALPYERVAQGLEVTKLVQDPSIFPCPDGEYYFEACPSTNPAAEKIVHTAGLADEVPLVPNKGNLGPPDYGNTYTWRSYVTRAQGVPSAGAYRATVVVSWNPTVRRGTTSVRSQTLIHKGSGSTDPATAGSGAGSYFFGDSALTPGSVRVRPNPGVAGGTGVSGLPSWDFISQALPSLSTDIVSQDRTRSETELALNGATKVEGGTPTSSGGATSVAKADDDPTTSITSSALPAGVSQAAVSVDIAGGGNRIGAGELGGAGGTVCPSATPTAAWMTGVEPGGLLAADSTLFTDAIGGVSADSTVARTGVFSAKVTKTSGSTSYFYKSANNRSLVIHFGIRLASLPSTEVVLGSLDHQGTSDLALRYRASDQKLTLAWGANAPAVSSVSVTAGTWYSLELKVDTNANPITAEWRLDGAAQPSTSSAETAYPIVYLYWGSGTASFVYTANYDDFYISTKLSDYPMGNTRIGRLLPDAMGTSSNAGNFRNNDGTSITGSTYTRLDDSDMVTLEDYVYQSTASSTSYLETTFADTAERCVRGALVLADYGKAASQASNLKVVVVDGTTERTLFSGDPPCVDSACATGILLPATSSTQAAVNALRARFGYSTDVRRTPLLDSYMVEYAFTPGSGGGGSSTPGDQSGTAAATVPPTSPVSCYAVQTSGACSYAQAGFASPAPTLRTVINLGGSGAGDCALFTHTPATTASSAYGRRDYSGSAVGSLVEDVVHYYGTNDLAGLCAGAGTAPAGWAGWLVRYDQGASYSCVKAAAGVQAPYPRYCSVGTISYWNGSGISSMSPSVDGAAIPVANLDYTSGTWRYEITASLASAPSSFTQTPASAPLSGTADRSEATAKLGAPVTGTISYRLTNTSTGAVVVDVTMEIDLGSLTASARYQA